jgi:hypothetical protein
LGASFVGSVTNCSRPQGAGGYKDGKLIDDGVAAMTGGAVDVVRGEDEAGVADGADEEIERGLGELHLE